MYAQREKPKENKSRAVANSIGQKKNNGKHGLGFVDNRPKSVVQRNLKVIANNNFQVMQFKRYFTGEVEPPSSKSVRYSEVTIQGVKATKRMQADNLSYKTKAGGSKTTSGNHSPLFYALRSCFQSGELHDMHMLHEELGGKGKPPNLVPGPKNTNNNMMDFEQAVIAKIDNSDFDFAVVDYEVTANYGRSGNDVKAALPTSIDMRVTEKKCDVEGKNWEDDNIVHTRNVSVETPLNFGNLDSSAKPSNEVNRDVSNPITTDQNHSRTVNSKFGNFYWATSEITRVNDPNSVLHHWKNHNLISENVEDPYFKFSQQQLEEGLKLTFKDNLDKLLLQLNQSKIVGKNGIEQSIKQHWKELISESATKSVGKFGYPKAAIDFFTKGLEKERTELSKHLKIQEPEYAMKTAKTNLKFASFAAWHLAKGGSNTLFLKKIANGLVIELEKGMSSLVKEVQERLKLSLSFFKACTMSTEEIEQNYAIIPEYINQMKITLGVD